MQLAENRYGLVLFDLDGTLVDTAPDMVSVLQAMQRQHGIEPVSYEYGRTFVSNGSMGLLSAGFPDSQVEFGDELHRQFLADYADAICIDSAVFDGIDGLLTMLEEASIPWGVVTNKPQDLTLPLLAALQLSERAACIVSGDTLEVRKPDPRPVLLACDLAGCDPAETIYVGDAGRDIEAGRRAGTATVAAAYGYIVADDDPREWQADIIATTTAELHSIVLEAVDCALST